MNIDERIARVLNKVSVFWIITSLVGGAYVAITYPLWAVLAFIPAALVYYHVLVLFAGFYLGFKIPMEEVQRDIQRKHVAEINQRLQDETPDTLTQNGARVGEVSARSEAIIGRLGDVPIHDWIEVYDALTKKAERYAFVSPAARRGNNYLIPNEPGKVYVLNDGLIFERSA